MAALLIVILVLAVIGIYVLLGGLLWMVGLGILSHIFAAPNLAISFWQAVVVSLVVGVLLGGFVRAGRNDK